MDNDTADHDETKSHPGRERHFFLEHEAAGHDAQGRKNGDVDPQKFGEIPLDQVHDQTIAAEGDAPQGDQGKAASSESLEDKRITTDFERTDIHLHVPQGAVSKDGPSAGVAITVALVSLLTGRRVRGDVAMTGEITLRGRVLPIGGVKEKVLGAHRAGIPEILLPRDNEADLEDIDPSVRRSLSFHLVETLDEAIAVAMRAA